MTSGTRPGSGKEEPARGGGRGGCRVVGRARLLVAVQRGAQDIAQRRTRIRAAIGVDRFLFLGDLAGLDRQTQAAGLGIDIGDARIHLVAELEPLGTLVLTITGQVVVEETDAAGLVTVRIVTETGQSIVIAEYAVLASESPSVGAK